MLVGLAKQVPQTREGAGTLASRPECQCHASRCVPLDVIATGLLAIGFDILNSYLSFYIISSVNWSTLDFCSIRPSSTTSANAALGCVFVDPSAATCAPLWSGFDQTPYCCNASLQFPQQTYSTRGISRWRGSFNCDELRIKTKPYVVGDDVVEEVHVFYQQCCARSSRVGCRRTQSCLTVLSSFHEVELCNFLMDASSWEYEGCENVFESNWASTWIFMEVNYTHSDSREIVWNL